MSQGFTTAPLSTISNVTNLQGELDSKANLSGATFTNSISGPSLSFATISGTSAVVAILTATTISASTVTATNFYGNGSTLTGVPTVFTGVTNISFDSFLSGETSYTSTAVTDSNVTSNSNILFFFSASTNHPDAEDSLLDDIRLKESNIVAGVGFTINATASNDTWGVYTIRYKIIN